MEIGILDIFVRNRRVDKALVAAIRQHDPSPIHGLRFNRNPYVNDVVFFSCLAAAAGVIFTSRDSSCGSDQEISQRGCRVQGRKQNPGFTVDVLYNEATLT